MMGKLIIFEGASASGKNTLLDELVKSDGVVVRGTASQNPEENRNLVAASRMILGGTTLNFKEALGKPIHERSAIFAKFELISGLQLAHAIRLKSRGEMVYINRSPISVRALIRLSSEFGLDRNRSGVGDLVKKMFFDYEPTYQLLCRHADGVVLMRSASVGGKEREGMQGMAERESDLISREVSKFHEETGVPVLELDANLLSVNEEISQVYDFLRSKVLRGLHNKG